MPSIQKLQMGFSATSILRLMTQSTGNGIVMCSLHPPLIMDPSLTRVSDTLHLQYQISNVKSSNAEVNAKEIVDLLGIETAAWYAGGCNDNANDAQAEIRSTFDHIMRKVEWNIDPTISH